MARKKPKRKDMPVQVADKTVLKCPKGHIIGTLKNSMRGDDKPLIRNIKFNKNQKRKAGEDMLCRVCGHPFAFGGNVRTETGWQPNQPHIERPLPRILRRSSR